MALVRVGKTSRALGLSILGLLIAANAISIRFRSATVLDVALARKILLQEKMNPLSISRQRLLVAIDQQDGQMLGFGQIRPLVASSYSELASLYVMPEARRQGVATALIQELLMNQPHHHSSGICLLTLRPLTPLYEKHGFRRIPSALKKMPRQLQLEYVAGSVISLFLGNELVYMERSAVDN